jgi:hypothetical protein
MGRERRTFKAFGKGDTYSIEANVTRAGRYQQLEQPLVVPAYRPIVKAPLCFVIPAHLPAHLAIDIQRLHKARLVNFHAKLVKTPQAVHEWPRCGSTTLHICRERHRSAASTIDVPQLPDGRRREVPRGVFRR